MVYPLDTESHSGNLAPTWWPAGTEEPDVLGLIPHTPPFGHQPPAVASPTGISEGSPHW